MKSVSPHFTQTVFIRFFILAGIIIFTSHSLVNAQQKTGRIVMDIPGYPLVFELNTGESFTVNRNYLGKKAKQTIKVISIHHQTEPNLWFSGDVPQHNYIQAQIVLDISGKQVTLLHRPYQMPVTVNGLRIFVETTKEWAENAEIADMRDLQKQVRLSVCAENEPWGPVVFVFPVKDYRWRSAVYNNTWSSLVPYNKLYYHRGEDYGAIPDKLDVLAPMDGKITASPLPDGDGKSNAIFIENKDGVSFRMSHMNTETIRKEFPVGTQVKSGTVLAKTGMTWDGRKSQEYDPHVHIELIYKDTKLASFPYLMEAYLRTYRDPVIAVAGGYQFATPDKEIKLDATRSLAGQGQSIHSYAWQLHNGQLIESPITTITYSQPGLYTEELIVKTKEGKQDRDFLQVQVYGAEDKPNIAYGWAYYYPVRNIKAGTNILFWNRLVGVNAPVSIDFGDGSPQQLIEQEMTYSYKMPGNYIVTLSSTNQHSRPVTIKLEVKVE
jgi:murein DD-endopeptidase MepM/ murein hydrolase activator NlpD